MRDVARRTRKLEEIAKSPESGAERENPGALDRAKVKYAMTFGGAA